MQNQQKDNGKAHRADKNDVYAAVDLGTHNCRLLIARPSDDGMRTVGGYSRVVRLGEGLAANNQLNTNAMGRTLNALRACAQRIQAGQVTHLRCVATEACRRAENGQAFLERVEKETGLRFEIVTPDQEAELTLQGCRPLLKPTIPHTLLFDIGGGSTEIVWAKMTEDGLPQLKDTFSFPMGVVTLTETYDKDQIDDRLFEHICAEVTSLLAPFDSQHEIKDAIASGSIQMIGTSGTVTTLGALVLELVRYERTRVDGLNMSFETIFQLIDKIVKTDLTSRQQMPCIGVERADLMVMGCAILRAICLKWPIGSLRAADRGIREGLILEMMDKDSHDGPNRVLSTSTASALL